VEAEVAADREFAQNGKRIWQTWFLKYMRTNENSKGLVLVAVLWMIVLLMTIVAVAGRTSRLDTKVSVIKLDEVRCKWACRAGVETTIALLIEDSRTSDALTELWSDNNADYNNVMLEQCRFNVKVTDEAGKLNINTITRDQLMLLPNMDDSIADAIIDWRDSDDTPTGEGFERGYYENLPYRYTIRNGPCRTIRELLLVRGVTEELLYGEDTNLNGQLDENERDGSTNPPADNGNEKLDEGWIAYLTCYAYDRNLDADGNAKININQAGEQELVDSLGITSPQARSIVQRRSSGNFQSITDLVTSSTSQSGGGGNQAAPIDTQTFIQIADKITTGSTGNTQGKININTASEEVLTILLGGTEEDRQLALNIIAYRATLAEGMQGIGELMNVSSMTIEKFSGIVNNITTRSDVFTIRCVATAVRGNQDGTSVRTEAVVDRGQTPCQVLYWYQGASN
jgi:type II secretory pathway component PulK